MSTYKKYVDIFAQRKSGRRDASDDRAAMADKQTYITFLENQLEKVSGSLAQVSALTETTEHLKFQVEDMDTKMANATRLLKLLQSFADAQEEDNTRINQRIKNLADRVESAQEFPMIKKLNEPSRDERPDSLASKCLELERKFNSLVEHLDTIRVNSMNENFHSGPPFNFESQDFQRQMQEFESKVMKQLNTKFEEQSKKLKSFEAKAEEAHERLTRDMAMDIRTLEGRMADFLTRDRSSQVPTQRSTSEFQNQTVTKAVSALKDDFYNKIEGVLNEVSNSVTLKEFDRFKEKVEKQLVQLKESTIDTEKICLRSEKLTSEFNEEIIAKISKFESKLLEIEFAQTSEISRQKQDYEDFYKNIQSEMANHDKAVRRLTSRIENRSYSNAQTEGQESDNEKRSYERVTLQHFGVFEDRLSDKISGSLEKFTEVIQKIIKRQKEFEITLEKISGKMARLEGPTDTTRTHGQQNSSFVANPLYYSELSAEVAKNKGNQSFASEKSAKTITKPTKDHFVLVKSPKQTQSTEGQSASKKESAKELQASFGLREVQKPTKDRSFASNKSYEEQDKLSDTNPSKAQPRQSEAFPKRYYLVDEALFEKKAVSKSRKNSKPKSRSRSASRSPKASETTPKSQTNENYLKPKISARGKTKSLKRAKSRSPPPQLKLKEPHLKRIKSESRSVSPSNRSERYSRPRRDSLHGGSSVYSSKKDTLKDIENRLQIERRQREEKIKTLLRRNKKRNDDTPKFTFDCEQKPTKQTTMKQKKFSLTQSSRGSHEIQGVRK